MTIPKFRVWDKITRQLLPVESILLKEKFVNVRLKQGFWVSRAFYEIELMQFTGLKDKNGKEVFEGDIVHAYGEDTYLIGVIEYFDNAYCIKNKNGIYNPLWTNAEQYEIIGNIWEDGELLDS